MALHLKINGLKIWTLGAMLLCASLHAVHVEAGGRFGYLAATGPTPIRFRPVAPRYDPAKVLPPLNMGFAVATNAADKVTAKVDRPVTTNATDTMEAPASPATMPAAMPEENETAAPEIIYLEPKTVAPQADVNAAEIPPGQSQITPQMLLRYFKHDPATGISKEILAPVEFTPPAPTAANRSSAVYLSPPAK